MEELADISRIITYSHGQILWFLILRIHICDFTEWFSATCLPNTISLSLGFRLVAEDTDHGHGTCRVIYN